MNAGISILFWNVNKNMNLINKIGALVKSTEADMIILNENEISSSLILNMLKHNISNSFYEEISTDERFHCFCRNSALDMEEISAESRFSIRKCKIGTLKAFLVLIHGLDIRNNDLYERQSVMQSIAFKISKAKKVHNTDNIFLIGDFNLNPYDRVMNSAHGFNAMMTKSCTQRGFRIYDKQRFDFYYNPMWGLLGDNTEGPPGTIHDFSRQGPYGWNMFDQVLLTRELIPLFQDVKILTETGNESLMDSKGRPDKKNASNHFPIIVNFKGATCE